MTDILPEKYRSAVLKNGKVMLQEESLADHKLSDNTLVIKMDFMGICRADIKEITGSRDIPGDRGPLFGHEFTGKIVYAGKTTDFKNGDMVTFNPNITPNRTTGFADYFFITEDKEKLNEAVIKIPSDISINPPWEPEPFACIVHSAKKFLELSGTVDYSGKNVAIIGLGNSGTMFGMYIKYLNGQIKFFNRGQMRIDFSLDQKLFSNNELNRLDSFNIFKEQFDIVIVVPMKTEPDILQKAFYMVKNNGFIHLYSGTRKDDVFLNSKINIDEIRRNELKKTLEYENKNVSVTGAYGCTKEDYEECFKLFKDSNDKFPLQKLVSKEISLNDFPNLVMDMANGNVDFPGKVIIKP